MNALVIRLLEHPWAEAAGWALVHFLWQGASVAALAAIVLRLMARRSAAARYVVGVAALIVLAASPIATVVWVAARKTPLPIASRAEAPPRSHDRRPLTLEPAVSSVEQPGTARTEVLAPSASAEAGRQFSADAVALKGAWLQSLAAWLRPSLPYCVSVWLVGVSLLSLRLAISWQRVQRWRRTGVAAIEGALPDRFAVLSRRLAVSRPVRLLQSTLVEVPTVIGWLRPVILLPVWAVTGLTAAEIEMILAHELAHVRRHDYLVNLAQTVVETLLFYHPAVWWLSARIRQERENCCDDVAVAACGDSIRYARTLAALEELRAPHSRLAVAASGGSLLARVRRLLGREPAERLLGGHLVGGSLLVALVVTLMWTTSVANEPAEISKLEAKLSDDMRVEVLGVSRQTSAEKPWWKPWGPLLPGNPFGERWPNLPPTHVAGEGEYREFALQILSPTDDLMSNVDFAPEQKYGSSSAASSSQNSDTGQSLRLIYVARAFTKGEKTASLIVRLGIEPWRDWVTLPLDAPAAKPEAADQPGDLRIERVFEHPGGKETEIVLNWPKDFDQRAGIEVESLDREGKPLQYIGMAGGEGVRGIVFPVPKAQLTKFRYRLRWHTHEVKFDGISLNPGEATVPVAHVKELTPVAAAGEDLTPAKISAEIKAAMGRFESVEYETTFSETRDANGFNADKPPLLVEGSGATEFRSDGERWFADESDFDMSVGKPDSWPRRTVSGFDGETYFHTRGRTFVLGQHEQSDFRHRPRNVFWRGGMSADWLLHAIEYFNARIERRETIDGHACVVVVSEPGKPKPGEAVDPAQQRPDWRVEITISPEQSWLPLKTVVSLDGKPYATETIDRLTQTPEGVWYPELIRIQSHARLAFPLKKEIHVTHFGLRDRFEDKEFSYAAPLGYDIVDYPRDRAWHNDPWWSQLEPWLRENLDWPPPDLMGLWNLRSYANPEIEGRPAPDIQASQWLNLHPSVDEADGAGKPQPPATWNRAGRKLTVLYFLSGYAIHPTPAWIAALKGLSDRYQPYGLEVICIADPSVDLAMIRRTIRALDIPFPVAIDASKANDPKFTAYGTAGYRGAYLVDAEGKIRLIREVRPEPGKPIVPPSPLESQLRELLTASGEIGLDRHQKVLFARRLALDVTGVPPTPQELESIGSDENADWARRYAERLQGTLTEAQVDWLKNYGITLWSTVKETEEDRSRLSNASLRRIEEHWKLRARERAGTASIVGRVETNLTGSRSDVQGLRARVEALPLLRLLGSTTPGGWTLLYDRDRKVSIDTDREGNFSIVGLCRGAYALTFTAPGFARVERTVLLADDDSQMSVHPMLPHGDAIGGAVVDAAGNPIAGASVLAVKRHFEPALPGNSTTARLPSSPLTTDAQGRFAFQDLYEGLYTLAIEAPGFAKQTVEMIPAGKRDVRVELHPLAAESQRPN